MALFDTYLWDKIKSEVSVLKYLIRDVTEIYKAH